MSVLAVIVVSEPAEAVVAVTPIDAQPWIAHQAARLRQARAVTRLAVVCQPACHDDVAPHVPAGVECHVATDPLAWAAANEAPLIAMLPVWQLFVDPRRLDTLAATPRPAGTLRVRAVLETDAGLDLTGGADVTLLTAAGVRAALEGADLSPGMVDVPLTPAPPELRVRGVADAGWAITLQRALLDAGRVNALDAVHDVMTARGLAHVTAWPDDTGAWPRRVLTVRCLPAREMTWLLTHLAHLPGVTIDVIAPAHLVDDTARMPGVGEVLPFEGRMFDVSALSAATHETVRGRKYDLCVVPRRTPGGRGFENVTPLGSVSGAALAVWMDLTGASGHLAGLPYAGDPWVREPAPWLQVDGFRDRARAALQRWRPAAAQAASTTPSDANAAQIVDAIERRLDETITCHALVDAVEHGLELEPVLVHRLPGIALAQAALARVRAQGRLVSHELADALDRAWLTAVQHVADAPAGDGSRAAGAESASFVDAVATGVALVEVAGGGTTPEATAMAALQRTAAGPVSARRRP